MANSSTTGLSQEMQNIRMASQDVSKTILVEFITSIKHTRVEWEEIITGAIEDMAQRGIDTSNILSHLGKFLFSIIHFFNTDYTAVLFIKIILTALGFDPGPLDFQPMTLATRLLPV